MKDTQQSTIFMLQKPFTSIQFKWLLGLKRLHGVESFETFESLKCLLEDEDTSRRLNFTIILSQMGELLSESKKFPNIPILPGATYDKGLAIRNKNHKNQELLPLSFQKIQTQIFYLWLDIILGVWLAQFWLWSKVNIGI